MRESTAEMMISREKGPTATVPMSKRRFSERGVKLKPAEEAAYGDPIPQNVNYIDQKSKILSFF